MLKKLMAFTLTTLISAQVFAEAPAKINHIFTLPIKSMKVVDSNGELYFMSENGRYVFRGELFDAWYRKEIDNVKDLQQTANRLDFSKMGIKLDGLATLTLGHGPKKATLFVDPRCPYCHGVLKDAQHLVNDYTFTVVPVPALGDKSNQLDKVLACTANKKKALEALINEKIDQLPQSKKDCDLSAYNKTLVTAQVLGINGVPVVIAPDGRMMRGRPLNLKRFLEA
ncbi:DsbC family protein [Piscirickettsia litoralis]|uniref:Thiol:disulfide interchange protein n=1 Tax=Piscirickettsia litoralis TaxID=1891921 RepID=A0ABX3A5K7_9GAMM|nr:DsbC family protein [Piscirickettsia litoralis]ODN41399.1 hypothetical protein BGC07_16665 [Piscirickettsia litoralis]